MRTVAISVLVATLLTSCNLKVIPNHFVIPAGYTGPIAVVSDTSFSGNGGHWEGERYVHVVPHTAVVCVASNKMLRPFSLSAEYSDGSPIYSYGEGKVHPPREDSIRIEGFGSWGGSTEGSYVHWFGVGDAATVETLKNSFFGGGIEKAMPQGVLMHNHDIKDFKYMSPHCVA